MIKGDKIVLRAIEPSDVKQLWGWTRDDDTMRLRDYPAPPVSYAETIREYQENLGRDSGSLRLAVTTYEGRLIGEIALKNIDHRIGDAELTIAIGDKSYWGRGYGTDASRTLIRYAFEQLNLRRLTLYVHDFNARAIRVYEKCGFEREGILREAEYMDGAYSDLVVMGLLRRNFEAHERPKPPDSESTISG
jgi:RimJ/RimL family protein N-acetyltransferase